MLSDALKLFVAPTEGIGSAVLMIKEKGSKLLKSLPLNKGVVAETGTPEYMQTVVLGEPAQNHHGHSWAQDGSAFALL